VRRFRPGKPPVKNQNTLLQNDLRRKSREIGRKKLTRWPASTYGDIPRDCALRRSETGPGPKKLNPLAQNTLPHEIGFISRLKDVGQKMTRRQTRRW
jgi:hypothetical protein